MQNSQIAQGNQRSIQVKSIFEIDTNAISTFIEKLKTELPNIDVQEPKKREIESEIATLNVVVSQRIDITLVVTKAQ